MLRSYTLDGSDKIKEFLKQDAPGQWSTHQWLDKMTSWLSSSNYMDFLGRLQSSYTPSKDKFTLISPADDLSEPIADYLSNYIFDLLNHRTLLTISPQEINIEKLFSKD